MPVLAVPAPPVPSAFGLPDAILLGLLALFAAWGALRGTARQALSLLVLGGALFGAGRLAPVLEPTVVKVAGLTAAEGLAAAWAVAFVAALAIGAVVLAFAGHRLPHHGRGGWDRAVGGLLGLVKGACVLVIVGYALFGGLAATATPALSRPATGGGAGTPADPPLVDAVRGSASARWMAGGAELLLRWLVFPEWIHERVEAVNQRLDVGSVPCGAAGRRRPRGA